MDHEIAIKYIQAFGFPVCVAVALFIVLTKVGMKFVDSFFHNVEAMDPKLDRAVVAIERIATKVSNWPSDPANLCKAVDALRRAGFDESTIEKAIEGARRKLERERLHRECEGD